ncbi:MAG: hypothetical protein KY054_02735 [Candidatus Nealsonbacteria bacterium]|nr:hypothetical protein [Candidatus Nealsonbacteria bacterium]
MKRWVLFIILLVIFLVIGGSIDATTFRNPIKAANFTQLLNLLINFLWVLSLALLPLAIMMSAFYFLTGGGNDKQITAAKNILLYAFMGFIIITAARGLIPKIIGVLTT